MSRRLVAIIGFSLIASFASPTWAGESLQPVHFQSIKVDGFWQAQLKRLAEVWIPHCIRQMEEGGEGQELLNLVNTAKALKGQEHGKFTGLPWSDAYVYNTVESICLALEIDPAGDAKLAAAQDQLREKLEEWIPIILAAQSDDGYIHSFHILNKHRRYSNIGWHEFYVQGYFLEMGVAHFQMTAGKDTRLLDAARRCADQLVDRFGPQAKSRWFHGHAGMGYALCRLSSAVNDSEPGAGDKYFELAKHLLDTRYEFPRHRNAYHQSHRPVTEMTDAVGHAVRGTYFYTAMADLAMLTGDESYKAAVDRIWDSAVQRKHFITGGVGASHAGEAFAKDFDLRNDGYCESCAGCGLSFWADRMFRMHHLAHHVDVQERTLYNNILGAMELSGENFFYQNPLSSRTARYSWHACPCCVGNIPRALLGIKDLMYATSTDRDVLYVNHFVASDGTIDSLGGSSVRIQQQTEYPWNGQVDIQLEPEQPAEFALKIRIPDRTESDLYSAKPNLDGQFKLEINGESVSVSATDGYATVRRRWKSGDVIQLQLPIEIQRVYCDSRVMANRGRVALIRGPIVYNIENVDHRSDVRDFVLPPESPLNEEWMPDLLGGVMVITAEAKALTDDGSQAEKLVAIPNYVRLNRGGWSQVWITEDPTKTVALEDLSDIQEITREDLDKRTIDRVVIGNRRSEKKHKMDGDNTESGAFRHRRWRHAENGGWFGYEMKVAANEPNVLLCSYWGSDGGNRRFRILVDGQEIASQSLDQNEPDKFYDAEYPIPDALVDSKDRVMVRLQAEEGSTAGGIFDLRVVRPEEAAQPAGGEKGHAEIRVQCDKPTVELSPHLYGLFFEDINYAADGGLYAELVQNRSFEYKALESHPHARFHPLFAWDSVARNGGSVKLEVSDAGPLNDNNRHYLHLNIDKAGIAGVSNGGFDGIHLTKGAKYDVSLYARSEDWVGDAAITVSLRTADSERCGSVVLEGVDSTWKKLEGSLTASRTTDKADLLVTTTGQGHLCLDMVSLFPQDTFRGRKNGLRKDLAEALGQLNPQFFRFPGGCIVHGSGLDNAYRWKDTVGDVAQRKPNWNLWGYHQTYGLGFFEYFQLCEDLNMAALPVLPIGVGCGFRCNEFAPMDELQPYIQDALDLIEFANGPVSSKWGAVRAEMGHPQPFDMKFICLGNEEHDTPGMRERFPLFVRAIRKEYPEIKIIGTSGLGEGIPIYDLMSREKVYSSDEHYYMSPGWFFRNHKRFDDFDRSQPLIFVGEYAAHDAGRRNTLNSALAEAAFLTGVERNADIVDMTCYAPLFGRRDNCQWNPDLIYFDKRQVVRTTNYYVQQMFGRNKGDVYLGNRLHFEHASQSPNVSGHVGVGTWNTTIEVERVAVNGRQLDPANWKTVSGKYRLDENRYVQSDGQAQPAMAVSKETFSGDKVTFEVRARKTGGAEGFLLRFGADAEGNGGYWWNVAGWNNTRHGLEKFSGADKGTVATKSGSVESGKWYDLKVVLTPGRVQCFIDNKLVQQYDTQPQGMCISSTLDREAGEIILKLVNPTANPVDTQIRLDGVTGTDSTARLLSLSGDVGATNSFERPDRVAPKEKMIPAGREFEYTASPYTLDVIRIKVDR